MPEKLDPISLTADLVRCPSVTPEEGGALVLLERVLSEAGLVTVEKRGRTRFCRLGGSGLDAAAGGIDDHRRFWTERLEALGRLLSEEEEVSSADASHKAAARAQAKGKESER